LVVRAMARLDAKSREIANQLHESLAQQLVGVQLKLETLRKSPRRSKVWNEASSQIKRCIEEIRKLSSTLYPPVVNLGGLPTALKWCAVRYSEISGIALKLQIPATVSRLAEAQELLLFQLLEESLLNTWLHSGATEGEVRLRENEGQIFLEVRDNGHSMPKQLLDTLESHGDGEPSISAGIRRQVADCGGRFEMTSDYHGTLIRVVLPTIK
jgi:two-component system, NarL family, sensor kinase